MGFKSWGVLLQLGIMPPDGGTPVWLGSVKVSLQLGVCEGSPYSFGVL